MSLYDPAFLLPCPLSENSPRCPRNSEYRGVLRRFGMNTTWYLQSHFVWLRLSARPSMEFPLVCLAAHNWKLRRWVDFRKCQTATATPAEPGGSLKDSRMVFEVR